MGPSQQSEKTRRCASHGRSPSYDEPDDEDENESEEDNGHCDTESTSNAEKHELQRVTSMANERMERRKRRMVSRSVASTTGDSRTQSPALPYIPYTPHVFPQAKRKGELMKAKCLLSTDRDPFSRCIHWTARFRQSNDVLSTQVWAHVQR